MPLMSPRSSSGSIKGRTSRRQATAATAAAAKAARLMRTGKLNPAQVPNENAAVAIARQVPGVDVILMGHTHRDVPSLYINGVLLTQADKWARRVARVDLYLEKQEGKRWHVMGKSAYTIPVTDKTEPDPEILKLAEPYDRETQAWLGRVIGQSPAELTANNLHLRLEQVSGADGDGILAAQDLAPDPGVGGLRRPAVQSLQVVLQLLGDRRVAVAADHVVDRLGADQLADGGHQRRVAQLAPYPLHLLQRLSQPVRR